MTAVLPDAAPANWVDRYAPEPLRPWLKLGRFDRPTGIWLLMLPGWQGIALADAMQGRMPDPMLLALFLLGAALMRAAGCAYNDIVDRNIDAQVARTAMRPVAAGQISVPAAWAFLVACSLAGLVILLTLNIFAVALGVLSLMLVAIYPFMKRITWWPQAWLGLTFNWGALLGFQAAIQRGSVLSSLTAEALSPRHAANAGRLEAVAVFVDARTLFPPLLLYAALILWTLGYDTIYAVQDLEDDALVGVKSSARRLGAAAPKAVLFFYAASTFLALAAWWTSRIGPLAVPLIALYGVLLARQPRRLRLDDPAGALALFQSNTLAGLALFAAFVLGGWKPI